MADCDWTERKRKKSVVAQRAGLATCSCENEEETKTDNNAFMHLYILASLSFLLYVCRAEPYTECILCS